MEPEHAAGRAEGDRTDDRSRTWDVGYESGSEDEYECLDCGVVVAAEDHPLTCPTCDSALRNRSMPIE